MSVRGGEDFKRKAKARVDRKIELLMKPVALDTTSRVVRQTPADKGTARVNWNLSLGRPDRSTKPEATSKQLARKTASNARKANRWDPRVESAWLTNALPYIGELENGSSTQAPAGFVRTTVEGMGRFARRKAREIRAQG